MADKKISELDLALQINNDAVFPMSQDNAGEPTTFKASITQLGTEIAEDMTFSNLQTTSKKLVGAINELLSLGSPIIIGTTAPTSSQGANGNIYVQYTEGTGGAPDTVDSIYAKIDGAWCEISTGGGSGTTDYDDLSNKPQINSVELVGNKSFDDLGIMPASLSKTVSGSIAHFTDGADNIPVKSLVSEIVAVESGSGTKSPENPYTISGFANGVITRLGKNWLNPTATSTTINGIIYTVNDDGTISTSGVATAQSSLNLVFNITLKTSMILSGCATGGAVSTFGIQALNANSTSIVAIDYGNGVTLPAGTYGRIRITFQSGANANGLVFKPMLRLASITDSTYEKYNGNTYTFTFGQTVYGGHYDNKGNLVVTHGIIPDLGSLGWAGSDGQFNYSFNVIPKSWTRSSENWGKCSALKVENWDSVDSGTYSNNSIHGLSWNNTIFILRIYASDYSTSEDLKTALSGQSLIYELATPVTLAITSQDIPTLLGENNIFSNCGDVEVNYYTDNVDEIVEVAKATASTPLHHYSEDEQVVGTWIDGKTLYEKTVIITNAGKDASYDLGITDFDTCFVYNGSFSGNGVIPYLHGSYPDNSIGGFLDDTGSSLAWAFRSGSQVPATISGFITVRYTKSST